MPLNINYSSIQHLVNEDSLILAPNSRTQKAIIQGQLDLLAPNAVGQLIKVKSLSQWIDDLWTELSFYRPLPKRINNLVTKLWFEAQVNRETAWTLTNPSGVANKAFEAYRNLIQWNLNIGSVNTSQATHSVEVEYFIKWVKAFESFCSDKKLITPFGCLPLINKNITQISKSLPKQILMVGFEHLTPLEELFFENITKLDIEISQFQLQVAQSHSCKMNFSTLRGEFEFAAKYAREFVDKNNTREQTNKGNKQKNTNRTLAVVVEQLSSNLVEVHRAFSQQFHPLESKPWTELVKPAYNVSAGFPLLEHPIVVAAMSILRLSNYQISRDELHYLKNTAFVRWPRAFDINSIDTNSIAASSDTHSACSNQTVQRFLHTLILSPRKNYSLKYILSEIKEIASDPVLDQLTIAIKELSQYKSKKISIESHIEQWNALLSKWCWSGALLGKNICDLNEFEIKACAMFKEAMMRTKEISFISDILSKEEALNYFSQILKEQAFQIASDHSEVQILGMLEANGLQFDELLIVGFNADNWPQKNKINPFIPLNFQRLHNMPGNSAQREFEYAKRLSEGLLKSSKNIIVTANCEMTNQSDNTSTFFTQLENSIADCSPILTDEENTTSAAYDWVEDSAIDLSNHALYGGAYLLSNYAKCPFRASANFQIKLSAYPEVEAGIDPKIKGSWLHDAMELIWKQIGDQQSLVTMNENAIETCINQSLETALDKQRDFFSATTASELVEIERNKLARLITEWLIVEKNRNEFCVKDLEIDYELQLSSLTLRFRVDRVDQIKIEDGKTENSNNHEIEIIDYKTGAIKVNDWFGVRPIEAQMPAYVLAMDNGQNSDADNVIGLSYGQIKTGEVGMYGLIFPQDPSHDHRTIAKKELTLVKDKITPVKMITNGSYRALFNDWQSTLERIAVGITSGWIPVSPKDKASCLYCDYRAICRIDEKQPDVIHLDQDKGVVEDVSNNRVRTND